MLLSVYSKPSLAGELSSLLLPSILAGAVLDHVLLLSGSCALRNTRWHLGTVPSHPYWPVLVHFQSSGDAGGTEASTDLFHQGCGFKKLISKTIWPFLVLFALFSFNSCPEWVSWSGLLWEQGGNVLRI